MLGMLKNIDANRQLYFLAVWVFVVSFLYVLTATFGRSLLLIYP